ncbi:hypothetical protein PAXRUDRAFT_15354 [Paxillus rubicundulus Ve08.2h10]|uniref:Uncharacterized protein n=1 Tax=Paxillus rubicundulus Ve08.2h10 TaxID=930991 RepID=A0A0D0DB13_9AGAM|nr:hypothetical protein PAXRUDRAFT_15354 [Paxillus rubicundulus Ve08.2h10]
MADPSLKEVPNYANPEFDVIREGLRHGYHENDQQAIECLVAAWQANRETRIVAWIAQKEADLRMAEEAEEACRLLMEEEEPKETEKKKPKMNTFTLGTLVADILVHPPSPYALQKLSTYDFVELWYFTLAGRMDAAKFSNKSQADDTFGISRVDDHLTVRSIASVRASRGVLPNHELPFPEFLRAKNCFLEHARKADWPTENLDALEKFFWCMENHPLIQLPLGEKIILMYATRVRPDWHRELKAGRGYNISVTNQHLLSMISDKVKALDEDRVKTKARALSSPISVS